MTNVIDITDKLKEKKFHNSNIVDFMGKKIRKPSCRREYLELCKQELERDDYEAVLMGVLDSDYYLMSEPQVQKVIDCYYSYPN